MDIRDLDQVKDLSLVEQFYSDAPDYWTLCDGVRPNRAKAAEFFTAGPPNYDPDQSYRLGLFLDGRLSGLAELSFGFPEHGDAYLGFMMLGPWARGQGIGPMFLAHLTGLARARQSLRVFLAVLEANPKGRAFWEREGFIGTGLCAEIQMGKRVQRLERMVKLL